jgi:hypothetical protein
VAAAGTIANVFAGVIAFAILARQTQLDAGHYCLWLFGCVSVTWGLLLIPRMVASQATERPATPKALDLRSSWVAVALLVAVAFVGVLGPGIRFSI